MQPKHTLLFFLLFIFLLSYSIYSQSTGDYRSVASGNWNTRSTWERYNGTIWVQPTVGQGTPNSASGIITIQSPHTVTVTTAVTIDQSVVNGDARININNGVTLTIANGIGTDLTVNGTIGNSGTLTPTGTISFGSGSTYQHSQNGGVIPTANWNTNSTCLITGVTGTNPTNMGQAFGNFTWHCLGQTSDANFDGIFTINGNFILSSTGTTGVFRLAAGTTNVVGNYLQSGGINRLANTSNRTLNVSGNFSMSGGELRMSVGTAIGTLNVSGNFSQTAGTITETSTGSGYIIFSGTTNQSYTGGGTISGTINFTFNNPNGVSLNTDLNIDGTATLTMTNGNINTGSFTLTLGTSTSNRGTLARTSGTIVGNFRRWFAAGTTSNVLFPIGTSNYYRPANISFTSSITTGGTLTAFFTSSNPGALGLPQNDGGTSIINAGQDGYWTINAGSGLTGGTYSLDLTADGFIGVSNYTTLRILKRPTGGGIWTIQGTNVAGTGSNATPIVHRTGMSGFSEFGVGSASDNALPVELSSFSAIVLKSGGVKLDWRTETEVNNYGFEVERSQMSDVNRQIEWEKLEFVEGNGNSNSPKDYSFIDLNATYGNFSYRLKQIDADGSFEYSKIIEVDAGNIPNDIVLEQNYPNPFNPSTTIKFALVETQSVKLIVYDILGNEVATPFEGTAEGGKVYETDFNGENLPSGIYLYRLETKNKVENRKMLLLK